MRTYQFENLGIWRTSLELVQRIYAAARQLPKTETFALADQMKRAAVSVSLNIAEGRAADTDPEFGRFLGIALKSAVEVVACLKICGMLGYLESDSVERLCEQCDRLMAQIRSFRRALRKTQPALGVKR
jgi:four helix bundle protein